MSVDPKKLVLCAFVLLLLPVTVYFDVGDALRTSDRPAEYIGLIFSVLAASLFATVSIVGDPGNLLRGGWRRSWEDAKDIQFRLMRLTYLFVLYLIVLALLVISEIIEASMLESLYCVHDLFAWVTIIAFLWSLWLPFEIKNIQVSRLNREIEYRRSNQDPKDAT